MSVFRTTIRLEPTLKKALESKALELDVSFQELCNQALRMYIHHDIQQKAKKLVFNAQSLGAPLGSLTREDIYGD